MKMMNHQCHFLALFLDAVPGHQVSQRLLGVGYMACIRNSSSPPLFVERAF
ncbi:hypothetical protein KW840_20865 [Pseudomonas sp. PDM30]|nr:hypothetical protein [Pseudomonas sp. PDM30]